MSYVAADPVVRSRRPRRRAGLGVLLRPARVMGVDVARAVAIVGMFGAHVGVRRELEWGGPETWSGLVDGRPSLLFAVLAGVSVALLTSGIAGPDVAPDAERLRTLRLRLLGRAATIFALGVVLELLGTGIAIILTLYGVLFVAVIPFLRWRQRSLVALAVALVLLGPALVVLLRVLSRNASGPGAYLLLFGSYPVTVWLCLLLVGLVVGRARIGSLGTAVGLLVGGAVLAVAGYGSGVAAEDTVSDATSRAETASSYFDPGFHDGYVDYLEQQELRAQLVVGLLGDDPHSGGVPEVVGSGGLCLAVLGLCLLLCRVLGPARRVLLPLAAMGSMPLSVYSAQVVAVALLTTPQVAEEDNTLWLTMSLVSLVAATVWAWLVGRGPLERLTARVADATALTAAERAGHRP